MDGGVSIGLSCTPVVVMHVPVMRNINNDQLIMYDRIVIYVC